jgi:hypothetical protein
VRKLFGRPRRWEDNIKMDHEEGKQMDLAQGSGSCPMACFDNSDVESWASATIKPILLSLLNHRYVLFGLC